MASPVAVEGFFGSSGESSADDSVARPALDVDDVEQAGSGGERMAVTLADLDYEPFLRSDPRDPELGDVAAARLATRLAEAAKAGFYESHWRRHPRIQILTADQILDGRSIEYPGANAAGLKKARRAPPRHEQMSIPGLAAGRPPSDRPAARPRGSRSDR